MKMYNEAEVAVMEAIGRLKNEAAGQGPCWCALCEADIAALALTILPPRYATQPRMHGSGYGASVQVDNAVRTSARRVARSPKHVHAQPERQAGRVRVINFVFEEGSSIVATLTVRSELPCRCSQCLTDTLAFALNRYPPKYGVRHAGRENLPSCQRDYLRHELGVVITHAASVVSSRPRHGRELVH